jgi:unsaturated chondroitin disaccharide hydrolase
MEFAKGRLRDLIERYPDFYPIYTQHGRWKHSGESWTHWCDGFLPGMLWIVYAREPQSSSDRGWWRQQAIRYSKPLDPRKHDRDVHDLGFIFMSTYYRWFRLTQDPALKASIMEAGTTLSLRFQKKGEYLCSFISPESLFIDIMMNVGIIFYTAIERNERDLMDIAMRHSLTSRRVLVRGDGSTAHEGIFNRETGEFLRQSTQQGFVAIPAGREDWRGPSMASVPVTATHAIRGFSRPRRLARISTSSIVPPMVFRLGTTTRRPRVEAKWIRRRRPSRRRVCSNWRGYAPIRSRENSTI